MDKELETYNPNRPCQKCGNDFVKTAYGTDGEESPDIIVRKCERCHYEWWEKPLN